MSALYLLLTRLLDIQDHLQPYTILLLKCIPLFALFGIWQVKAKWYYIWRFTDVHHLMFNKCYCKLECGCCSSDCIVLSEVRQFLSVKIARISFSVVSFVNCSKSNSLDVHCPPWFSSIFQGQSRQDCILRSEFRQFLKVEVTRIPLSAVSFVNFSESKSLNICSNRRLKKRKWKMSEKTSNGFDWFEW